jgi:iron(III) transport system substrate-binding protein
MENHQMHGFHLRRSVVTAGLAFLAIAAGNAATAQEQVNVYSARQETLIQPQIEAFTEATGIVVRLVTGGSDALIERIRTEGVNSPADVLLTVDVGRLVRAKDAGVVRPVESEILNANIPSQYRDASGYWYGLGLRSRVIFYAPDRVDVVDLSTYESLADPMWRDRVCIRSSSNVYNQSLLASMVAHLGGEAAEAWAAGVVANMARVPQGGDRDQILAVAAGECDIAVANTYYFARMLNGTPEQREATSQVRLFWPNQEGRGAHMNISGGAVTVNAPNPENALKFLEFLTTPEAQQIYASSVFEYPVRPGVELADTLVDFGPFKADSVDLESVAAHQSDALRIFDRVGWR